MQQIANNRHRIGAGVDYGPGICPSDAANRDQRF